MASAQCFGRTETASWLRQAVETVKGVVGVFRKEKIEVLRSTLENGSFLGENLHDLT